jgi:hypothetical protein
MLPAWWVEMYSRDAKGIRAETWSSLMAPTEWKEVLNTIKEGEKHKAAGWDGMSTDLVRLLVEDADGAPTPFLLMMTDLINFAITTGQTPYSWRKAIITMIQKKKRMEPYRRRSKT